MWGFHDSYGFPGDDLGTSVLACNAARALADMYDYVSDAASAKAWSNQRRCDARGRSEHSSSRPDTCRGASVRERPIWHHPTSRVTPFGRAYFPKTQADAASDWLAKCYRADKKAGGAADLFNMTIGCRGSVRMARKADDRYPGSHVWPHVASPHWENLAFGYNAYQDGGYWYYMSLRGCDDSRHKHPAEAKEWVANTYGDLAAADSKCPYERIDWTTPVNDRYNASVGYAGGNWDAWR